MMRVLILANDDEGLYQFRKELIIELLEKCEVYATVPEGPYKQDLIDLGVNLSTIAVNRRGVNPIEDIKLLLEYKKMIKDTHPDVVLTYTIKPNVYGGIACQMCKVPYIVNITGLGTAVENGGILQKITLFLYKIGIRRAKKVFFQNAENRDFMINKGVIRGESELIPGSGVNLCHFEKMDYPSENCIRFSFISRIMKEKGIDQYLEAAKYIRRKYPNTEFHVCGYCEQDYTDILNEYVQQGIIIYHGCIRDVREMHKISNCTVHPTYYPEGLSNVLLESLSCCRPIITTNRSGCKEVVDDGINGFVVEQKNSQDLINKIEKFILLPYEDKVKLGMAGRKKVEQEFDRTIVVNKYIEAIWRLEDDE